MSDYAVNMKQHRIQNKLKQETIGNRSAGNFEQNSSEFFFSKHFMGFKQQRSRDLSSKLIKGWVWLGCSPSKGWFKIWVSLKMWIPGWLQSILYMAVFSREDDDQL